MSWKRSRIAAAGVATACTLVMLTGVNLLADPVGPAIHAKGIRLQNVLNSDGTSSIQALVDIYATDIPKLTTATLVFSYRNPDPTVGEPDCYWQPSRYADNTTYTGHVTESTFFQTNPDLYAGSEDPFLFNDDKVRTEVDVDGMGFMLGFNLKAADALPDLPGDSIETMDVDEGFGDDRKPIYINATDEVLLGTLSFRVDPRYLEQMADKAPIGNPLENWSTQADYTTDALNDFLFPSQATGNMNNLVATQGKPWQISYLHEGSGPNSSGKGQTMIYDRPGTLTTHVHTKYEIPDVIIKVEAANKTVVVNAYQAYTDATPADLAATLQRYSSAVRVTYPNGDLRDEAMFWGNTVMTVEDQNSGKFYQFQYDATSPYGYTFQEVDAVGTTVLNPDARTDYDPTHGHYIIKQSYSYVENGQNKTYPVPVTVDLTVTPVTVVDVNADDLRKLYKIDDPALPGSFSELELPSEGRIVFDTVLSGTIPTLPLTTWTNAGNTLPVASMGMIEGTNSVPATVYWPATVPVPPADVTAGTNVGDYTFHCDDPTAANIRALHPWATVTQDYTIDALRIIRPWDATIQKYIATADVEDIIGRQHLQLKRADGTALSTSSTYKILGPDGLEIPDYWFTGRNPTVVPGGSHYIYSYGNNTEINIYTLPGITGSPITGNFAAEREKVRAQINLGGYFTIVVDEQDGNGPQEVRVYQRRRQNAYTHNYTVPVGSPETNTDLWDFEFTGHQAGLYPFYKNSTLPSVVVLPFPNREPTDALYQPYTVATRYDGVTGAEPGEVRSFAVSSWTHVSAAPSGNTAPDWASGDVVTYGEDEFSSHSYGSAFGLVENPGKYKVRVQVEPQDILAPVESLRLTYEGPSAPSNILNHANGEVSTVVFDTKQQGYPYKQEFELTLTNDGTTDIHGIYIDPILGPTQNPVPDGNQHFEIIKPPATDLAPGASTTFVISYVLGLPTNLYIDNIYVGTSTGQAKTFIARFRVVDGKPYQLRIQPRPEDKSMGDGGAVIGITAGVYDSTPVGSTLLAGEPVWVLALPDDEYAIKELTAGVPEVYYYENGNKVYLTPYTPTGTQDDPGAGKRLFELNGGMPAHDTTVYIDFYEPVPSKLRLTDLHGYADSAIPNPLPTTGGPHLLNQYEKNLYDLTDSTYQTVGFTQEHLDYLVVVPFDADVSGLKLTLYDIVAPYETLGIDPPSVTKTDNVVISPTVKIQLIDALGQPVVLEEEGTVGSSSHLTSPTNPTTHESSFSSPDPGKYFTAEINISYRDLGTGIYYERPQKYTVKFIRQAEVPIHTFAYGNTPYGMIMNASNIAAADKAAAKAAYDVENRFDPAYTPAKAKITGEELTDYFYWPETWQGNFSNCTYSAWPNHWGERNLDRNDYALAIYVGEEFKDPGVRDILWSTGDKVHDQDLKRWVDVVLLDTTGTETADKFNGTTVETIDLPDLHVDSNGIGAASIINTLATWEQDTGKAIRPGIYALHYSFIDYNGATLSFTRPLVILRNLGDVDADGMVDTSIDAELIRQRFAQPLGLGDDAAAVNYPASDKSLYRYRVLDVNNDRNINNIDANRIKNNGTLTDFYRPVDYIG